MENGNTVAVKATNINRPSFSQAFFFLTLLLPSSFVQSIATEYKRRIVSKESGFRRRNTANLEMAPVIKEKLRTSC